MVVATVAWGLTPSRSPSPWTGSTRTSRMVSDKATNAVAAPDGKHAYVSTGDGNANAVQVVATASDTVVATERWG
jgi:hypothetical protein